MNEDRYRVFHDANREIAFICECTDPECRQAVVLTPAEYQALRPGLVLYPGHASDSACVD